MYQFQALNVHASHIAPGPRTPILEQPAPPPFMPEFVEVDNKPNAAVHGNGNVKQTDSAEHASEQLKQLLRIGSGWIGFI